MGRRNQAVIECDQCKTQVTIQSPLDKSKFPDGLYLDEGSILTSGETTAKLKNLYLCSIGCIVDYLKPLTKDMKKA